MASDIPMAENGFVPLPGPLGYFVALSYLKEQCELRRIRYVCILKAGALTCNIRVCCYIKLKISRLKV